MIDQIVRSKISPNFLPKFAVFKSFESTIFPHQYCGNHGLELDAK